MADLKVFISSTCYDLEEERKKLKIFIESLGYDAVCSECYDVLYDPEEHTHTSCVEKVKECDMLVLLIGGRFGGRAVPESVKLLDNRFLPKGRDGEYSITQLEYFYALQNKIPVFPFVKENVYEDHGKYIKKKKKSSIFSRFFFWKKNEYKSIAKQCDADKIFEFIDFVRKRRKNNAIIPFATISDIEIALKKQWSSLFKKMLKRYMKAELLNNLETSIQAKDEQKLFAILNQLDMQALTSLSKQDPHYMDSEIINVWEPTIEFYYKNPNYLFNDDKLNVMIRNIFDSFYASGPCDLRYDGSNADSPLLWRGDGADLHNIYSGRKELGKSIETFVKYVNERYPSVNILDTNKTARKNNQQFL